MDDLTFVEHLRQKAKATDDIGDSTDFAEAANRIEKLEAGLQKIIDLKLAGENIASATLSDSRHD